MSKIGLKTKKGNLDPESETGYKIRIKYGVYNWSKWKITCKNLPKKGKEKAKAKDKVFAISYKVHN